MKTNLFGIDFDNISMSQAVQQIKNMIDNKSNGYVVTPNVDHIVRLQTDNKFREIYLHADLVLTDGKPIIWASRFLRKPIKEKISGSDIFPKLCELSARFGYRVFLLGAAEGVAAEAAERLKKKYSGLNVVGTYSPKYGFEGDRVELNKIFDKINSVHPDILIVGLGSPKQEYFIYDNLSNLNVPVSLGLGASLDFEAGNIRRAPKWMQQYGLEWLFRITQDPIRLLPRYLKDLKFIHIVLSTRKNGNGISNAK
jgi:N-acetylglucosaminyldiphosphoundecaprenol N-acetyl-beta-D-mannosaminyltransferase